MAASAEQASASANPARGDVDEDDPFRRRFVEEEKSSIIIIISLVSPLRAEKAGKGKEEAFERIANKNRDSLVFCFFFSRRCEGRSSHPGGLPVLTSGVPPSHREKNVEM